MNNYIINNNTVAILKNNNKTIIFDVDNYQVINKNIKYVLECNCNYYGSSLEGRRKSIQKILNTCYKVPILINNKIILLQINSLRNNNCLFIVLNKVLNFKKTLNNLIIRCDNNLIFSSKISQTSFEKMLINGIKINNIIKSQKNENIV